jgi:hypothetical protein
MNLSNMSTHWPKLIFCLIFIVYAIVWAPIGLDTKDGGFMLGMSWRVLHGDVPYRDFIYVRPPIPLYVHIIPLLFGDFVFYTDRIITLTQFAVIAVAGSAVLFQALRRDYEPTSFWSFAACCFVMSVHNFPLFGWYTIDGVFFCTLALLALMRRNYLLSGALAAAAMLCKQNFAAIVLLLGAMAATGGLGPAAYYFSAAAVVVGGMMSLLAVQGGFRPMLVLMLGVGSLADIWNAGVIFYAKLLLLGESLLAVIGFTVMVLLRRGRAAAERTNIYTAFVIAILAAFLTRVLLAGQSRYMFGVAIFYGAGVMFLFSGAWTIGWTRRNWARLRRRPLLRGSLVGSVLPMGAVFAIAWSSSISFGYATPAYFAVPMLAPILLDPLPASAVIRRLWLITACALVAFGVAFAYPYGEGTRADYLVRVPSFVRGAALMRTSAENAAKLRELNALIAQHPGRAVEVLPAFTSFDLLFDKNPPSSVVWSYDVDFPPAERAARTAAILDGLCKTGALIAVEKDVAAESQRVLYSSVVAHVEMAWRRIGETVYFALFDPPETCLPGSSRPIKSRA